MGNELDQLDIEALYQEVSGYIKRARENVLKSVNHEQVVAYWQIGRRIIEQEQDGENRANYGNAILEKLSEKLASEFGKGFGTTNLRYMRQFYLKYPKISIKDISNSNTVHLNPNLSWTHYRLLIRETRYDVRSFYEIEAGKNHWSTTQLERQMNSFLYERLAKSKDKEAVLELANQGQVVKIPEDSLKEPVILDFLGLKQHHVYTENNLESAIIDHLQDFLLEMGAGFAFVGRQKRLTIDGDHFYPDLVFYHIILKCYVILDLKTHKLEHRDVGQMQMYVNYYDRAVKQTDDNPTIGLLLCSDKNDSVVKYTLAEDNQQIFARKYQFHLPTTEQLKEEIEKERKLIEAENSE